LRKKICIINFIILISSTTCSCFNLTPDSLLCITEDHVQYWIVVFLM